MAAPRQEELEKRKARGEDVGVMAQFSAMKSVMGRLQAEMKKASHGRWPYMANIINARPMDARGGFWWKYERSMKFISTFGWNNRSNYEVKLLENPLDEPRSMEVPV